MLDELNQKPFKQLPGNRRQAFEQLDHGGDDLLARRVAGLVADEAEAVMYAALSRGLSFKLTMGNILTLTPALIITQSEMDRALDIIDVCLYEVEDAAG